MITKLIRKIYCFLFHRHKYIAVRTRWWYAHLVGAMFQCPSCSFEFYHSNLYTDYGMHFSPSNDPTLKWENEI